MRKIKLFIYFCILLAINLIESTKLNYPRVLLPIFDKIKVNFTLEVIEKIGCYKWTSSRQDLIQIQPIYDDYECSSKAIVTVMTRDKHRNTAIVLAEDITGAGEVLRCDVILDVIHELEVMTTTHELFLEEAPETFQLFALDDQGNSFTTLEGVEFDWKISQTGNVLKFLTFTESKYHEVPKELVKFEASGTKGYMGLLEGINTGTANVDISINYREYKHVKPIKVSVAVLANIILDPTDVHIMVGDTIDFRVLQLKQGKLQEISLNKQYYLEIVDTSLATISRKSITGLKLGKTLIYLRDRNMPSDRKMDISEIDPGKSSIPRASLTVSIPSKMTINLLPYFNWMTVEGEKHEIAIDLYTSDDQKILLGPRYKIDSQFDETIFYPLQISQNGSRIYGEALLEGQTQVRGLFDKLTANAELQIYKELTLNPKKIILPFDPNAPKSQKVQFTAKGGDGTYSWLTYNPNLVQINQNGLAEAHISGSTDSQLIFNDGDENLKTITKLTHVKVALLRNTKIFRTSEIFFLPPVKLEIIKYNFETALTDYVRLQIALYSFTNKTFLPFTKCDNLNYELEFSNQIFQIESTGGNSKYPISEKACHIIYLRSTSVGMTQLKIQYRFMDTILKDEVTLMVFDKLQILNPLDNEIILPIGAGRNIIYTSGPQKIFNLDADLIKNTEIDSHFVEIQEIPHEKVYAFNILCRKIGETDFKFEIYNSLQTKNFEPYRSIFLTRILCVKPRFINLYATQKIRDSCPVHNCLMHLKGRSSENLEIQIEVLDSQNRKLTNISSLQIDWEFGQNEKWLYNKIQYQIDLEDEILEGIRIPGKTYFITTLQEIQNNFKIKATVVGYIEKLLQSLNIFPEEPNFGVLKPKTNKFMKPVIENEISLMAVNSTLFPFESISIYLASDHKEHINILQGSGYYDIELSEKGIITVEFDPKKKELIIVPQKIGHVVLELIDRCLMNDPARLSVSVVSINFIKAEVIDRIEKTKSVDAIVKLYDSNDNLLSIDSKNLQIYQLHELVFNPSILSVKLGDQKNLELGEIRYIVTGNELGETKIVFNTGKGDEMVASEPVNIQVFSPLRLYPRNSTLVIGSSVQIYHQGGPQPDVNIFYTVHNQNVAIMDSALLVTKKLGTTRITGKSMGIHPCTGKEIAFSEDTIETHVVPLERIQIRTPLVRIRTGAIMPASVWGVPELSPMILGTLESMKIIWSTNQPDVIEISSIFSEAGIEYGNRDLVSVHIKALSPGKARIQADVVLDGGQKLTTFVEVTVFKILELESPKSIKMDSIRIPPRTTIQLKSNLDNVSYKLAADASGIIKCTTDGIVKSDDTLGRDLIIARTFEQTLPIDIEVKNVQYILARLEYSFVKLKQPEKKIPRGMNLILKVTLHDNLGNEFSHSNIEDVNGIKYDLSHKDMVDVQIGNNFSVAINLPRETKTMLAISLKDSTGVKYAEDYIKISVKDSSSTFPTKLIFSVGDVICFDSPLTLGTSNWRSSNERLVTIDRNTGIAKIIGSRNKLGEKIIVTNGDKSGSCIKYDLEIREADKIEFLKSYDILSDTTYHGYLVTSHHLQNDKFSNLIAKNISKCSSYVEMMPIIKHFKCSITSKHQLGVLALENYRVTPSFDKDLGLYLCNVELITSTSDILNIIKTNDVNIELEAQLPNGISDSVTLKIVPGIKVTPDTISVDQINQQGIIITGLDKVLQKIEVKPSDTSILEIIPQAKTYGSLQYKLKLLNELPLDKQMSVQIHSPLTLQDIELPIEGSHLLMEKCKSQPFFNSSTFFINFLSNLGLIFTLLLCLFIAFYVAINGFSGRNAVNVNTEVFNNSARSTTLNNSTPHSFSSVNRSDASNSNRSRDSPIYGDPSVMSPQARLYRRAM